MADTSRILDGFGNLITGVDSGKSNSLILPTCVAAGSNLTFRGSYAHTRPPWTNIPIIVPANLSTRWAGIYQGSGYYDGWGTPSGWIISRGGLIFFLDSTTFTLQEITINSTVIVTVAFTVPAVNVVIPEVPVSTESVFSVGQQIVIDSGTYQVTAVTADKIDIAYLGGAAHPTVAVNTVVYDTSGNPLTFYDTNLTTDDFVFVFQAENYGIVLAGKNLPLIWDGSNLRRAGPGELPPAILGAYGWGRIWLALPDQRSFIAGNLVGDQSSGTVQNGFRDAILKFTDNDYLNGGGTFCVPINAGPITTMQFLAAVDTSFGMGVLLVGTTNMVFSVNAPVDRTTWQNLTYPIQTVSLIDYGPQGPRNSVPINGDMWYRSVDGIRSFQVVNRYFGDPGNVPSSREMDPILSNDTRNLLFWGSGINFDNKLLETISPFRTTAGVQHRGLVAINYDLLSDLRQKAPPAWEGVQSGLSILQLTKGTIDNTERGFMFVQGPTDVELWEIQRQGLHDTIGGNKTRIASWLESRAFFSNSNTLLKKVYMLELYLDDIADDVDMTVKFQPDQYPDWVLWGTLSFCASVSQCQLNVNGQCQTFKTNARQYAVRVLLPQPNEGVCNPIAGIPLNLGYMFQIRLEWVGHVEVRLCQVTAKLVDQPMEGYLQMAKACTAYPICDTNYFLYSSRNGTVAVVPPQNIIPPDATYDDLGFYELTSLTPGTLYVAYPGFAEGNYNGSLTNGTKVYTWTSPGSIFPFPTLTDSLTLHVTQPNLPVGATILPVTSASNMIPAGSLYDGSSQFVLNVSQGAFYVIQLSGEVGAMTNGPDVIVAKTLMSIQAKANTLVFTSEIGPGPVGALVLPTNGVQQF